MADEHVHDGDSPDPGFEAGTGDGDQPAGIPDISALLRTPGDRETVLRVLVDAMMPDRVNPATWERWLAGGPGPFERKKLEQPDPGGQSIQRALDRQSPNVARAGTAVQNARRALVAAQKKMEAAERKLANERSEDAALVEYAVSGHLAGILEPMFAMGPAWTVMRAISGHTPPELIDETLSLVRNPARRLERGEQIRQERKDGTDHILHMLDRWGGDIDFEFELREAIEKVVDRYAKRERPDRPGRTRAAMRATLADPELRRHREEIVDGMKRTGD